MSAVMEKLILGQQIERERGHDRVRVDVHVQIFRFVFRKAVLYVFMN